MKININGKVVEVADADLSKAIEEKKETIEVKADFVIRTEDEEKTFLENTKKENIKIGAEVGRKEVIKGLGIEGEGLHKSDETSINALKSWAKVLSENALKDAKIEPNKKIEAFEKDINTLKSTISTLQNEKDEAINSFNSFKKSNVINNSYRTSIPENAILPADDMVSLLSTKIKADITESGQVVGLDINGDVVKDTTTLNPIPFKDVVRTFFDNNPQYLKASNGGAGGGDSGSGGETDQLKAFTKEMEQQGFKEGSEPFNNEMMKRITDGTLKV